MNHADLQIRPIDPGSPVEIEQVALRMRATLVEVLGEARGGAMYTHAWLVDRVHFHLDPQRSTGQVLLAEGALGAPIGHTIVRVEADEDGPPFGLISTTYVLPEARRTGVGLALLRAGEAWIRAQGLSLAITHTSATNHPLIALYTGCGYRIILAEPEEDMIRMGRSLGRV